jgi:hypothetical protein
LAALPCLQSYEQLHDHAINFNPCRIGRWFNFHFLPSLPQQMPRKVKPSFLLKKEKLICFLLHCTEDLFMSDFSTFQMIDISSAIISTAAVMLADVADYEKHYCACVAIRQPKSC